MFFKIAIFVMLIFTFRTVSSAKIFGLGLIPSYSHQEVFLPVFKELSKRGHQVTLVTPNPLRDAKLTNLTEIDVSNLYKHADFSNMNGPYRTLISEAHKQIEYLMELVLQNNDLKSIYQNTSEQFDVVIVENHTPLTYAFGAIFKAPIIGITSCDILVDTQMALGNPIHPVLFGDPMMSSFLHLTVGQKIQNVFNIFWAKWHYNYVIIPQCDKISKKYFGDKIPPLSEALKYFSIMLVSNNNYIHQYRPLASNIIPIGFLHVRSTKPLPQDLKNIMDESTQGIIYVSFGTNVKSSTFPPEFTDILVKTFSDLPYTILWKRESADIPRLGKNIVIRKWFPQQDVLAHPNVKAFVTQGGLQSIEEAISRAVPMVGVPFIADQKTNTARVAHVGIGENIDFNTLTKEGFREAIVNVAEKEKYKEKIEEVRDILLDQPMTGLEKAVWWTEYVIRHKGAKHLRSVVADTPLWEYLMLDVIAILLTALIISLAVVYKLLSLLKKQIQRFYRNKIKVA